MGNDKILKILMVEDIPADMEIAIRELKRASIQLDYVCVETKDAFLIALNEYKPDIIISDYALPQFDGMKALKLTRIHAPLLPFIVVTGSMTEDTAVACMKAGASDYVIKEHIARLPFAVKEALEKYRMLKEKNVIEFELDMHRKNLEKLVLQRTSELEDANKQLIQAEKMASIGLLAAGVAHEINNPVAAITTNLFVLENYRETIEDMLALYTQLESNAQDSALFRESLSLIREFKQESSLSDLLVDFRKLISESRVGAERVAKIIVDLKTFAQEDKLNMESVDINEIIDRALNVARSRLVYTTDIIKKFSVIPGIRCYPRQMEQVFINILLNSAQSIVSNGKIIIQSYVKDKDLFIKIEDSGQGIPEKDLSKVFDPFFTTKEVGGGTGLGLTIVYNIIKKHNGDILVESVFGKGTTVTIRLPMMDPVELPR